MTLFVLGIHAIILTVSSLAAYVGYETGKRVGHRKGMADAKIQQAHIHSCREKGVIVGPTEPFAGKFADGDFV